MDHHQTDIYPSVYAARRFATVAHAAVGQRRKYTGEPYIVHPREVVDIIIEHAGEYDLHMLKAAWLHDVVEDTHITHEMIREEFGVDVGNMVLDLTDVSQPEDGNRRVRKALDRLHTKHTSNASKTIKLADLISNTSSIVAHDPGFAQTYLAEKKLLLDEALRGGDQSLYALAYEHLLQGLHKLDLERE